MPFGLWDAALVVVKTVAYATTLGSAGTVFFLGYSHPLLQSTEPGAIRRVACRWSVLAALAGGAQLFLTAGSMGGDAAGMWNGELLSLVWQGGYGREITIRVIGLWCVFFALRSRRRNSWSVMAAALGAVLACTSFAWMGHARSLSPDLLPVVLLCVHLLGVSFWLGALLPLLIVIDGGNPPRMAATVARFSAAAVLVVGALVAAGLGLLWMLLGSVSALWSSAYGRYLSLKLLFVAGLLCCAAFNKWRLTPRLMVNEAGTVHTLRVSIRLELLLAASILTMTAVLTTCAGPPALD